MELGPLPKRHLGSCSPPEVWCLYSWGRAYSHAWTSATTRINDFEQKQQLLHPSEHTLTCDELLQGGRVDKLQGISYSNQAPGECFGPDDPGGLFLPYWFYKCMHFGPVQRTLLHPRVPSARDMTLPAEGRAQTHRAARKWPSPPSVTSLTNAQTIVFKTLRSIEKHHWLACKLSRHRTNFTEKDYKRTPWAAFRVALLKTKAI